MVTQVTNFGRNGVSNWILQRFSAILIAAYLLCVTGYLLTTGGLDYASWKAFITCTPMAIFSTATLLAIIVHAWIGLWSVSTDYLTTRMMGTKGTVLRLLFQAGYTIVLFTYLVWGLKILWG